MTITYKNATGTSCIEVVERWNGNDIILTVNIGNVMQTESRHNLSIAESDKLGAALCRDKIADLEDEVRDVRYYNATLRDEKAELESMIHNLRDHVREHNTELQQELDDCKKAFFNLLDERRVFEAANRGLESDISNLRMSNALYRKRWNEHETESASPESYGMRSRNFERMVKGYHGKLSRHGKTIIITLPFEHESVARNAEKYIVGLED